MHDILAHSLLIVAGDFNARIGRDSHHRSPGIIGRYAFHDHTNEIERGMRDACKSLSLHPAQHVSPATTKALDVDKHWRGKRAQLDHILSRSKWVNSIRNCRAYFSVELDSDHRIVTATMQVSLRSTKPKSNHGPLDWNALKESIILQKRYSVATKYQFDLLYDASEACTAQEKYDQFEQYISNANREVPARPSSSGRPD